MNLIDWWRRLFSARATPPAPPPPHRPRPADWNRTLNDLLSEKRTIGSEEIEWARSYERDTLRTWARFPRDREVFEATHDVAVDFITHWAAPCSGGGQGTLPAGSQIRVRVDEREVEPLLVYADPLDDGRFEREWVPESQSRPAKYTGFNLGIPVAQLNRGFRLIG